MRRRWSTTAPCISTWMRRRSPSAPGSRPMPMAARDICRPPATPLAHRHCQQRRRDILASHITLNLNEPSKIEDTSWIKPTKYVGVWWEMITGKSDCPTPPTCRRYRSASRLHQGEAAWSPWRHHCQREALYRFCCQPRVRCRAGGRWNIGWEDWFGNSKDYVFDFQTPYPDFDIDEITAMQRARG